MKHPAVVAAAAMLASGQGMCQTVDWATGLAKALTTSPAPQLTDLNVAQAFAPWVTFDAANCATARLPSRHSRVPITSALVIYANPAACNAATELRLLQFYVEAASPNAIEKLQSALSSHLPSPCFQGSLPQANSRRHAPARSIEAWKLRALTLAIVTESGLDDAASVSVIVTDKVHSPAGEDVAKSLLNSLPQTCR